MAQPPNIPLKKVFEPNLTDLLTLFKKDIMLSLNCHAIGTVQSVDFDNQTLNAVINYKKTYFDNDKSVLVDYPALIDCPFISLCGGNGSLTFPIEAGDQCVILFNDRDIDNWFQGAGPGGPVASARLHSLSDGLALVGLNTISPYDNTRVSLNNGSTSVGVGASLIRLKNATTTLAQVINGLISLLETAYTIPTVPAAPATLDPAFIALLESYKTTVLGLLE